MTSVEKQLRADLHNATFAFKQAQIEQRSIQATIDRLRWKIEYIASVLGEPSPFPDRNQPQVQHVVPAAAPNGSYEGKRSTEVIEDILRKHGGKMRVPDIAEIAIEKGYGGPAVDRKRVVVNFSSVLARSTKNANHTVFKKVGRGLFAAAEGSKT